MTNEPATIEVESNAEWAWASTATTLLPPGTVIDADGNTNDQYAIVSGDGYVVLQGTLGDWVLFAHLILAASYQERIGETPNEYSN